MRTHIILSLLALFLTACASKREVAQTKSEGYQHQQEQFSFYSPGTVDRAR